MNEWRRARTIATAVALLTVLGEASALAADIGLVARDPSDPFVARLALELEQLGLSVDRTTTVASSGDVVVLEIDDASIVLHELRDHGIRKKRPLLATKRDPVEVAEEVHARLLPLVAAPPPPPSPLVATPPADPDPPVANVARAPRFEVGAGAGAILGAGSPGVALAANAAFFPTALRTEAVAFGAAASGIVTVLAESLSGTGGSAEVRPFVFGAEAVARFEGRSRFGFDAAVGAAVQHVTFDGKANAPFRSQSDDATCVSPTLRARGSHSFGRVLAFVEARTGFVFPEIAIRLGGDDRTTWGRPWAHLGGGVAFVF